MPPSCASEPTSQDWSAPFESYVSRLLETVTLLAQPALATPAQVDELLMSLVDRVTAQCAPREASEGDVLTGATVNVVARDVLSRMRDHMTRKLIGAAAARSSNAAPRRR